MGTFIHGFNYERRIDSKQGTYIVAESREFETILEKRALELLDLKIDPGQKTDLHGFFNKPCEFVGFYEDNGACFYLGNGNSNLFGSGGSYYDVTFIISEKRLFKKYTEKSGRDFLLVRSGRGWKWK